MNWLRECRAAASEAKLRTLVESQPECVKLLARDGSLLEMNRAGLAMLGADNLEQLKGKQVSCLALPANINQLSKILSGGCLGVIRDTGV